MIVFPEQLIGAVIHIAGGIGAVRDARDVAVSVVGIAVGNGITVGHCGGIGSDLGRGGGACGRLISITFRQDHRAAVFGRLGRYPDQIIVIILYRDAVFSTPFPILTAILIERL